MRSIPEKVLEHWASMYIQYRYRSHARLWWPTQGAPDVAVGPLPAGKAFSLEIKTAEPMGKSQQHTVEINLAQLDFYISGRSAAFYYVFPIPPWTGVITDPSSAAWRGSMPVEDLGFSRAGHRWFGEWTVVVPALDIYRVYGGTSLDKARVTISPSGWTWSNKPSSTPPIRALRWRDFWNRMDVCGSDWMPADFVVPADAEVIQPPVRSALVRQLARAAERPGGRPLETVQYLARLSAGNEISYLRAEQPIVRDFVDTETLGVDVDDRRIDVHLGLGALRLS